MIKSESTRGWWLTFSLGIVSAIAGCGIGVYLINFFVKQCAVTSLPVFCQDPPWNLATACIAAPVLFFSLMVRLLNRHKEVILKEKIYQQNYGKTYDKLISINKDLSTRLTRLIEKYGTIVEQKPSMAVPGSTANGPQKLQVSRLGYSLKPAEMNYSDTKFANELTEQIEQIYGLLAQSDKLTQDLKQLGNPFYSFDPSAFGRR